MDWSTILKLFSEFGYEGVFSIILLYVIYYFINEHKKERKEILEEQKKEREVVHKEHRAERDDWKKSQEWRDQQLKSTLDHLREVIQISSITYSRDQADKIETTRKRIRKRDNDA